jgi:signal transduction histidine kinase
MLSEFVARHRVEITRVARERLLTAMPVAPTETGVAAAVPIFLDDLIAALPRDGLAALPRSPSTAAGQFGHDLHRLGFTLSQVVHGYGAVCQVVTSLADEHQLTISTHEFHVLNRLLDDAIAIAVTQFDQRRSDETRTDELTKLGFLAHELRNTLATAVLSVAIIRSGKAGVSGKTADVLDRSLSRMRDLIDRSMAEVRLRVETTPLRQHVRLLDLIDELETTAAPDAARRNVTLNMLVDGAIEMTTDRQLLVSAISNLVQNAIKYTKAGTRVQLEAQLKAGRVLIEVEDACGGLPPGRAEELFTPFVRATDDPTGVGLGLTIARRAAIRLGGGLSVRDLPGKGCVFTLSLPPTVGPDPSGAVQV